MNARTKQKLKVIGLFCLLVVLIVGGTVGFLKFTVTETFQEKDYVCKDPYVYWTTYELFGLETAIKLDSPILSYSQGLIETQDYYYYEGLKVLKKDIKLVANGYYINKNGDVLSFKGDKVGEAPDATYLIAEKNKVYVIEGDYLRLIGDNSLNIYLGGNIKQVLFANNYLFMINNFNQESHKAAFIKMDATTLKTLDLLEISDKDTLYQVCDGKVYFESDHKQWAYEKNKVEIPYLSTGIYGNTCAIEFKENDLIFKQINTGNELGRVIANDMIKGVALR